MADKEHSQQQDPKKAAKTAAFGGPAKTWHNWNRPNPAAAAAWFNEPPAQAAGEAMVSNRSDGSVDVYALF
jgi:hypothetical protein